jgi:hypothetical protein
MEIEIIITLEYGPSPRGTLRNPLRSYDSDLRAMEFLVCQAHLPYAAYWSMRDA